MQSDCDAVIRQRLVRRNAQENAVKNYIGIQSQFYRYAKICCKLCGIDLDIDNKKYFKAWTLRGTLHIHHMEDYNTVIFRDMLTSYMDEFWNDESIMTISEKKYFSDIILSELNTQNLSKKQIIDLCMREGLSVEGKEYLFNPWGGLPRYLIETGKIILLCDGLNTFSLAPEAELSDRRQAEKEQVRRYIIGYNPCTLQDIMYFFKWGKRKTEKIVEDILETSLKNKYRIENNKYIFIEEKNAQSDSKDVYVLSAFDPLLLGYEKKENPMLPEEYLRKVFTLQGIVRPTIVYNGKIAGIWNIKQNKIDIEFFQKVKGDRLEEIYEILRKNVGIENIVVNGM